MSAADGHSSGWKPSSVKALTAVGICVFCTAGGVGALAVLVRLRVWTGATGTEHKGEGTRKHRNKHTWSRGRRLRLLHDLGNEGLGGGIHSVWCLGEDTMRKAKGKMMKGNLSVGWPKSRFS